MSNDITKDNDTPKTKEEDSDPEFQVCPLCNIPLIKNCEITILSCGHHFHARCLHGVVTRNYGFCLACGPGQFLVSEEEEKRGFTTTRHPIDWGDDIRTEDLISKRIIMMNQINILKNDISGPNSNGKRELVRLNMSEISQYLSHVEEGQETKDRIYGKTAYDIQSDSNKVEQKGLVWSLKDMISKAFESDEHQTPSSDIIVGADDVNPLQLIKQRISAKDLVMLYRIDMEYILSFRHREVVTLADFMENGYNIEDLVLLGTTWYSMKKLGLVSPNWRKWKRSALPINQMAVIWKISMSDIFIDICKSNTKELASMELDLTDMRALGVKSADEFIKSYGINRSEFRLFSKLGMREWKQLGMTIEDMRALRLSYTFLKNEMLWFEKSGSEEEFEDIFGFAPTELDKEKMERRREKREKTNGKESADERMKTLPQPPPPSDNITQRNTLQRTGTKVSQTERQYPTSPIRTPNNATTIGNGKYTKTMTKDSVVIDMPAMTNSTKQKGVYALTPSEQRVINEPSAISNNLTVERGDKKNNKRNKKKEKDTKKITEEFTTLQVHDDQDGSSDETYSVTSEVNMIDQLLMLPSVPNTINDEIFTQQDVVQPPKLKSVKSRSSKSKRKEETSVI